LGSIPRPAGVLFSMGLVARQVLHVIMEEYLSRHWG